MAGRGILLQVFFYTSSFLFMDHSTATLPKCVRREEVVEKQVALGGLKYYFGVCVSGNEGACPACSQDPNNQVITGAWCDGDCKIHQKDIHDNHFIADIPGSAFNTTNNTVSYQLHYEYTCTSGEYHALQGATSDQSCRQKLELEIRIADYSIGIYYNGRAVEVVPTVFPPEGSSISLICSSSLQNSLDIPVEFVFTPALNSSAESHNITCPKYNNSVIHGNGWTVERQHQEPHDCVLNIASMNTSSSGSYQCVAFLPNGSSGITLDLSDNSVNLLLDKNDPLTQSSTTIAIALFAVIVALSGLVVGVFILVIPISYFVKKRQNKIPPEPVPVVGSPQDYGSNRQTHASLLVEHEQDEESGLPDRNDLETPDVSRLRPTGFQEQVVAEVYDYRHMESSFSDTVQGQRANPPRARYDTAEISLETDAKQTYKNQTDSEAPDGDTPPSSFPEDPNYTCPYCGRRYRINQRRHFTRHVLEKCPYRHKSRKNPPCVTD